MPQDPQPQAQGSQLPSVPGEDKLLDILRNSPLKDNERRQLWETYHTSGDEKAFTGALNKLDMNDDTKKAMYEMRWLPPKPSASTQAASSLDTRPQAKGDVRPSTPSVLAQAKMQLVDPAIGVGQQTLGSIKDVPSAFKSFTPEDLQKGKELMSALPFVAGQDPGRAGAYVGATVRRAGQLANDALGIVSSPFNLATASIQQHIQTVIQPWQELAKRLYGQQSHPDPATGRYTTGNEDIDKTLDNVVGSIPFAMAGEAFHEKLSPLDSKIEQLRNQKGSTSSVAKGKGSDVSINSRIRENLNKPDTSTPLGPISETGGQNKQVDFTTKSPTEAQAPKDTGGASKVANAPVVDRQALIAPRPEDYVGKETPVPLYRFPKEAIEGMPKGETRGLGKVDLSPSKLPDHDTLVDAMIAKGVDNRLAESRADELLGAASGKPGYAGVERRNAPVLIDHYMGGERRVTPVEERPVEPQDFNKFINELHSRFDSVADLGRQADLAEEEGHANNLHKQRGEIEKQTQEASRQYMNTLPTENVGQFRDAFNESAERLEAQSKAIKDLTEATIKNRGVKTDIADLRSPGGPVRSMVDPETGERVTIKPESKVGRSGRSVLDELQGRVPTSEFENIKVQGKPEGVSDEEWAQHVSKLQEERQGLKRKISDSVTIASETGASIADLGIEEHVDRLKQIDSLLGKYSEPAETGRRPNIAPELDEQGAIKAPEPLKSWTKARADLVFGKNLRSIPTDEEFFQHADMKQEKGRLFRGVATEAQRILDQRRTMRGGVGEPVLRGKVEPVSLVDKVPGDEELFKRALSNKIFALKVDEQFTGGRVGLLSKDGKTWIDSGHLSHDDIAHILLPELQKGGSALRAMLDKGWIRKASPRDYEAWNLDSRTIDSLEKDMLMNGTHGQPVVIETRNLRGEVKAVSLEGGWPEQYKDLEQAITVEKRKQGWSSEAGALRTGTKSLIGSTAGAVVGSVVGAHLGDPFTGGAIGWGIGFITPAIVDHPLFWTKVNALKSGVTGLGIKMSDWLQGPKQLEIGDPTMETILDAQRRDVKGPTKSLLNRLAQIPGDIWVGHNKFAFLNDQTGRVFPAVMKLLGDERGKQFYDLRGKLDVDNSPYVSAWLAAGGGGGVAEAHLLDYKKMVQEVQSKGLTKYTNAYLNLRRYQQVYDIMQERIQDANQSIQKLTQALQQPNLHVEVEAGMRKALRGAKEERQDIIDKLTSKTLVPQPYDPPRIASALQNLQARLGPRFSEVEASANRLYSLNRKVLDALHDEGIVGDPEYQKYAARENGYIPMHRILEQIADNTGKTNGTSSPLYLRQQNVVKALMGSDRINRDPVVASADANLEAFKEIARNKVAKDFMNLAQADPQGVGSLVKEVKSGYKAASDKGLIGFYENGMPRTFEVPSWLSESLKNVSPASQDIIGKGPLQYFGRILRQGATLGNLAWSVPNALRHLGDMAIMSEAGIKSIKTLPRDVTGLIKEWNKSLYSAIVNDPVRQEFLRSGASYSTLQSMISPEEKLDLNTLGFKQKIAQGRIIDTVADFNRTVEEATKMTTYKRLRQAGYSEKNAAWETRRFGGGPDFAVQGNMSQAIGMASMFYNAHLQYVSRVFTKAQENPARVAVALGAITAMAMSLNEWNYNQKDEKGNLLMRKVPFSERENYFVVLTGDTYKDTGMPVKILLPKPSFVKFLYNPIENTINKMDGHEERSGTALGMQAIANLLPGQTTVPEGAGVGASDVGKAALRGAVSSLNPILKTPIEEAMNYKTTGTGGPIVPTREQTIDPHYQFGINTSQTAKQMGEGGMRGAVAGAATGGTIGYLLAGPKGAAIGGGLGSIVGTFGISPRRAEHIIDSTTAGVGRMATGFLDPFLGGVQQTKMGSDKITNLPVVGPIAGRFVGSSMDQQEQTLTEQFYRDSQKMQQPLNTLEFLKKNSPQEVLGYIQSHKDDLWQGQVALQMQSRLGQLNNAQRMVEQNTSVSDADKAEALKNLREIKLKVLSTFTQVLRPSPQVGQAAALPGQGQGAPR